MKFGKIRGFTVIELMIVVSIFSTISSTIFVSMNSAKAKGKDSYRVSQVKQVQNALALYYSKYGNYPSNTYALSHNDSIPGNWASMMTKLRDEGYISVEISKLLSQDAPFAMIKQAHAVGASYIFYGCSIQDPLYKTSADFDYSFAYVASTDLKSYKIRIRLEDPNSAHFNYSYTGPFLDAANTGITACDKTSPYQYFCTGSIL